MHHHKALSLLCRLAVAALLVISVPTLADAYPPDNLPRLSMAMPTLENPGVEDALPLQEISVAPQLANTIDLTVRASNLWERIRNGFAMTNLNDDLVLHYQQWYQNRPDALRRMVERSRPYLHYIVEELEARGMPTELALLPMVESSFNPNANSPAHAAGLWQFIPSTGKRFNLEQNWWRDERRDIVSSTSAALDYLQTIYDMQGDWHLALASYNWGEGAVKRAVGKNESRGLPTDYPNLTMPNETRNYVPKLQALKNIFGDPEMIAKLDLPIIPNEPYFATLETRRPMDVKTAARLANISLEEFQRLNPSHNRPIIKADTPLVIPTDKVEAFRSNLKNAQAPLTQWQAYTLTTPQRLERIAANFDTTTSELARVNGLSEKVRLGIGSTLLVPGSGNSASLNNLLNASEPPRIIEPEPVARGCGKTKRGKASARKCTRESTRVAAKGNKGAGKLMTVKAGGKQAKSASKSLKAVAKSATRSTVVKTRTKATAAKPAKSSAKAAKPKRGQRS